MVSKRRNVGVFFRGTSEARCHMIFPEDPKDLQQHFRPNFPPN